MQLPWPKALCSHLLVVAAASSASGAEQEARQNQSKNKSQTEEEMRERERPCSPLLATQLPFLPPQALFKPTHSHSAVF